MNHEPSIVDAFSQAWDSVQSKVKVDANEKKDVEEEIFRTLHAVVAEEQEKVNTELGFKGRLERYNIIDEKKTLVIKDMNVEYKQERIANYRVPNLTIWEKIPYVKVHTTKKSKIRKKKAQVEKPPLPITDAQPKTTQ